MSEALTFKSWLTQPGNHRQLQGIKASVQDLLKRKIDIRSWPDLYQVFEETIEVAEPKRGLFDPIFKLHPPSIARGATEKQVVLYRGALHNPSALPQSQSKQATITYRGNTIVKEKGASETATEKKPGKARYYRGVKIED